MLVLLVDRRARSRQPGQQKRRCGYLGAVRVQRRLRGPGGEL